jgi:hypothetical protein
MSASFTVFVCSTFDDLEQEREAVLDAIRRVQSRHNAMEFSLTPYRAKFAIIDGLAQSDPGNTEWQRDLSVSYIKMGDAQVLQGDLAGALKPIATASRSPTA